MTCTTEKFDEQSADKEYSDYSSYITELNIKFAKEDPDCLKEKRPTAMFHPELLIIREKESQEPVQVNYRWACDR